MNTWEKPASDKEAGFFITQFDMATWILFAEEVLTKRYRVVLEELPDNSMGKNVPKKQLE